MLQIPIQVWHNLANFVADQEDQQLLMLSQEELQLRLHQQDQQMLSKGYSETVILAYQYHMMQVYLMEEIIEMNLQAGEVQPVIQGMTAAEAVTASASDHLLNSQEINQLYELLIQLELP